jgi:hypothetical protein
VEGGTGSVTDRNDNERNRAMGKFATLVRRGVPVARTPVAAQAHHLEERFAGFGEALSCGGDGTVACAVVGRRLAREGVDLGEALDGLRSTSTRVTGRDPSYAAVHALGTAWGDEMLGYLHGVSCEDPMTGLASPAHLRARLGEVYGLSRSGVGGGTSPPYALVVAELDPEELRDSFDKVWQLVRYAERVRWVFPGEGVCRIRDARLVVLTRRAADLGRQVSELRSLLEGSGLTGGSSPRLWVEGLPQTEDSAARLLDELSRRG